MVSGFSELLTRIHLAPDAGVGAADPLGRPAPRRLPDAIPEIPVVVLSADATTTQSDRPTEAGASAYLTKPIDVSGLLNALDLRLGSERTERVTP